MIVRIMTEDQYRLSDQHAPELRRLDDALEQAMDGGDAAAFSNTLSQLVTFVREHGSPVGADEVLPSDAIVPAPDMSLDEARERLRTVEEKSQQPGE